MSMDQDSFWQAVDEANDRLADSQALIIVNPAFWARVLEAAAPAHPGANPLTALRLEVETDVALPSGVLITLRRRHLPRYRDLRASGHSPAAAAQILLEKEQLSLEEDTQRRLQDVCQRFEEKIRNTALEAPWEVSRWALLPPDAPEKPQATPERRRRFPIPR